MLFEFVWRIVSIDSGYAMSREEQNMEGVDVLVVGARPVGLLPGTGLQRDGIGVCVIDGMPARGFFCEARGITPRTLEIFDDLGIVDRAIGAGVWLTGVETWVDGAMMPARSVYLPEQGLPYGSADQRGRAAPLWPRFSRCAAPVAVIAAAGPGVAAGHPATTLSIVITKLMASFVVFPFVAALRRHAMQARDEGRDQPRNRRDPSSAARQRRRTDVTQRMSLLRHIALALLRYGFILRTVSSMSPPDMDSAHQPGGLFFLSPRYLRNTLAHGPKNVSQK
ncbi:FAD-dependent monooxygenase [Paraburkholderia azotifigens]|uniref:FAD-dependent monooxygenase n=1 Tax=Paraburkholderia azotifigens TaxID=2057004 RepID=A0ABU9QX97_9BURK|nr:FAD-dependent monooxygenase [Paraburkholderia azotifigens]